jgi:hypothetical protein
MDEPPYVIWAEPEDRPAKPTLRAPAELAAAFRVAQSLHSLLSGMTVSIMHLREALAMREEYRVEPISDAIAHSALGELLERQEQFWSPAPIREIALSRAKELARLRIRNLVFHGGRERPFPRRRPTALVELYERRLDSYRRTLREHAIEKQLGEAAASRRLMAALMDHEWFGLRLLESILDTSERATATRLSEALGRDLDSIATMLTTLASHGVIEVKGRQFVPTARGSAILDRFRVALERSNDIESGA